MMKWKYSRKPGYDLHDALRWACKQLDPKTYLEIGVDGGGSLETVLSASRPNQITLCDMWGTNHAGHGFENWDHILPILKRKGVLDITRMITGDSRQTVPTIDGTFDLITVDGDHSYEVALADIRNAWPLLRAGGIIAFDDVGHANYPGVFHAFEEFMAEQPYAVVIEEEGGLLRNCVLLTKEQRIAA